MQLTANLLLCMDSEQRKGEYIYGEPQEEKEHQQDAYNSFQMHWRPVLISQCPDRLGTRWSVDVAAGYLKSV